VPFSELYEAALLEGPVHVQLLVFGTKRRLAAFEPTLHALGRKHRGRALVVFVDTTTAVADGICELFGVPKAAAPPLGSEAADADAAADHAAADEGLAFYGIDIGTDFEDEVRYASPLPVGAAAGAASGASLEAVLDDFVQGMLDGTAPLMRRSQPPPESNHGPVAVVVADTFDALVNVSGVDVLLEVYAPWCGHCKQLEPTYTQLGARFRGVESVVIAKMDGTQNEVPRLVFDGFPTLFLFTASGKQVEVGGDVELSLEGLTRFVQAHAERPFDPEQLVEKDEL